MAISWSLGDGSLFDTGGSVMRQNLGIKVTGKGTAAIFTASRLWQSWHEPAKCQGWCVLPRPVLGKCRGGWWFSWPYSSFAEPQHRNYFCAPKRSPKPLRCGSEQVHLQIWVALPESINKASLSTSLLLAVCDGLISTQQ